MNLLQQNFLKDRADAAAAAEEAEFQKEALAEAREAAGIEEDDVEEEEEEEEDEADEDEEAKAADYESFLEMINQMKDDNDGRLDEATVIKMFRDKLLSSPCLNQGYVMEGYPKTTEQAHELFGGTNHLDTISKRFHFHIFSFHKFSIMWVFCLFFFSIF